MLSKNFPVNLFFFLTMLFCTVSYDLAQDVKKTPEVGRTAEEAEDDDVLKIGTELIQTGVQVFNKKGQFVDNLAQEDFQLLVDGKPVSISFFEQNMTRNAVGEAKIEKRDAKSPESKNNPAKPLSGRNVIFVVDDFHLSFDSTNRVKKLILNFINREMLPEDTVAVVSPSGKIGFLQQFTDDKTVLRAAVERLIFTRDRSAADRSIPPMSEYEAQLIARYDQQVTDTFAELLNKEGIYIDLESARELVRGRARTILNQAATVNRGTYSTLQQAVRNSAQLPGRKIVFFVSDGFLLDVTNSDSSYQLQRITDQAARTNTVIYSFDAKGLEAGFPEGTTAATTAGYRVQSGERFEAQDGLALLADETGGRFVKNTNDLQTGLTKSLDEASQFYLLAWEPATESGKSEKFKKIEVIVKNRPELKVRVQSGYLSENLKQDAAKESEAKSNRGKKNQAPLPIADRHLNRAVSSQIPARQLSTFLTVNHVDVPNDGAMLAAAMQIKSDAVEFAPQGERAIASVDIVGTVYNSDGKREGYFRQLLTVEGAASKLNETERPNIYYNYQTKLKPGLYQMRVAARDAKSGRVGSANQWIKIPDLSSRKLTLSSLILSEQKNEQTDARQKKSPDAAVAGIGSLELPISVERRFARSSQLRYIVFIYNATQKSSQPEITLQTQIFRGQNLVITSPMNPISAAGQDPTRLPYAAEISLKTLPPGRYELQVTVQDRTSKTDATQRVRFEVK